MKKMLVLVLAPFILAACASTGNGGGAAPQAAAQGNALYCWKGKLNAVGDDLSCNWAASASEACESTSWSTLKRATLAAGPQNARMCSNGQWLVMVTTR